MLYACRVIRVDDDTSYPYHPEEILVSLQAASRLSTARARELELVANPLLGEVLWLNQRR